MVRYPLGAVTSWSLQYLSGFRRLGHEVTFVEKAGYEASCFDPHRKVMTDDCRSGVRAVSALLEEHGFGSDWCYIDSRGEHHGLDRRALERRFSSADVFIDMGMLEWVEESAGVPLRVWIDGEPGYTQIRLVEASAEGQALPEFERYYTVGMNVGGPGCAAPTAGIAWGHIHDPVNTQLVSSASEPPGRRRFTGVMNWQSHGAVVHNGMEYGQKDAEFPRFSRLPAMVDAELELAVAGEDAPRDELQALGWHISDPHSATASYDRFLSYIDDSMGEFAICKQVFVALRTGCFSDRSALYLARGRPVVMLDTGFGNHLPTGEGLFAVNSADEAASAIESIRSDHRRHSAAARAIACEYLDTQVVLSRLLSELGC
jgi:hypothetical protein